MNERKSLFKHNLKNWFRSNPKFNPFTYTRIGFARVLTSSLRILPDFIIIGVEKGGTTSLYDYLIRHPSIISARTKEVHYFDTNYLGLWWYKAHFPTIFKKILFKVLKKKILTGEATPYYIFHPLAASRIFKDLPNVKLIVILRDPVDKAYSQYYDNRRKNQEELSFEDAIQKESERTQGEKEKIIKNPKYNSKNYWFFSYLSKGIYSEQLKHWFSIFPRKQFLILETIELQSNPQKVLNEVFSFLGIPKNQINIDEKKNVGKYEKMIPKTRSALENYFSSYNIELEELLDRKFSWTSNKF